MPTIELVNLYATLGPILSLLALGFAITLPSGVAGLSTGQELRRLAGNLAQTVLLLGACLVALALLQQLVGFRPGL